MLRIFNSKGRRAIDPIQYLINYPGLWKKNESERKEMSISCRDTDYIPKVEDAGVIKKKSGKKVQVMHEGTLVELGGYHGDWMSEIITELKGHHEPQEEKIFFEILQRCRPGSTMIEFGSFWAYYSLWFSGAVENSKNICCEPDLYNLAIGERNAKLNKRDLDFMQAAVGSNDGGTIVIPLDSNPEEVVEVMVRTVDSIMSEKAIDYLEVLHLDVQGHELEALKGAAEAIKAKRVRFVCVSTHHYFFSKNPNTHNECLSFIKGMGGQIISSHTVAESFSGDGLIVASFEDIDKDFQVDTSLCHTDNSLFRSSEDDIALLADLINNKYFQ
jgi:FkbM family methyltransferase